MSYSGMGYTFGGKIGGSVEYSGGELKTDAEVHGSKNNQRKPEPTKTYTPVTQFRATAAPMTTVKKSGVPWVWVGAAAGLLLVVGGVAYVATR